ncbi:MAG TPA: hypothetical protein VF761_00655 [Gemmatimonadaceae bacterium]
MTSIELPSSAVELRSASPRSAFAMAGWPAVLFGGVFVVAGTFIVARGALGGPEGMNSPRWVVGAAGMIFLLAGLWVSGNGAADVLRTRNVARRAAAMPREPWAWDYEWRRDGIESESRHDIARAFGIVVFIAVFSLPFHWIGFFAPRAPRAFAVGAVLMDVALLWLIARAVRLVLMRRRYGRSWLRFARFPFRAGDRVELSLDSFGALSLVPSLQATLRCVQERYETRGTGKNRSTQVVCYALWSASATVEKDRKGFFDFGFDIPAGAPSSALRERPARYWELVLASGDVPGVDYEARFLVPIY